MKIPANVLGFIFLTSFPIFNAVSTLGGKTSTTLMFTVFNCCLSDMVMKWTADFEAQ